MRNKLHAVLEVYVSWREVYSHIRVTSLLERFSRTNRAQCLARATNILCTAQKSKFANYVSSVFSNKSPSQYVWLLQVRDDVTFEYILCDIIMYSTCKTWKAIRDTTSIM